MQNSRSVDQDTEKRYQDDQLTPTEKLVYFGKKKMDIVFKLLTEDIIETTGPISILNADRYSHMRLSELIAARINKPLEFVLSSVEHIVNRGYLTCDIDHGYQYWHWA
jgi:hypothetical protein